MAGRWEAEARRALRPRSRLRGPERQPGWGREAGAGWRRKSKRGVWAARGTPALARVEAALGRQRYGLQALEGPAGVRRWLPRYCR